MDEIRFLKTKLRHSREQPYNRKLRSDDLFSFNVYEPSDLDLAKAIIVGRFNHWVHETGRLSRTIEL